MPCYVRNNLFYCAYMDNPNRHLVAIASGILGGVLPNKRSNIHPLFMGCLLSLLFSKILFGDYDKGYNFTISDVLFFVVVGAEGVLGAYITELFPK